MGFTPFNVANGALRLNSSGKIASAQLDANLADINGITSPSSGDVIKWDGSNFVAGSVPVPRKTLLSVGDGDLTTGAYTLTSGDAGKVVVVSTTGATTINLPALSGLSAGDEFIIKRTGSALVTVDGNASEQIDGANTATLPAQYESMHLVVGVGATAWLRL